MYEDNKKANNENGGQDESRSKVVQENDGE